ncbi:MAG TPA: acyltransferase [Polyangiaceae bacterium]|jgi:maltose O-acetyltransferase|nr:acyltransferase [Polyangiaceae bacterium]
MNALEKLLSVARQEMNWDVRKLAVHFVSSGLPHHALNRLRTHLLIQSGIRIGQNAAIGGPLRITGPGDVASLFSIGDGSFVSGPLHVDLGARVKIGARVYIGDDVKLLTGTHEIAESQQRCGSQRWAPIEIGDGSWIGSAVTILPGATIGNGAIIGAGAVVTGNVPPDTLYAGVPARFVRDLEGGEQSKSSAPQSGIRIVNAARADTHPPPPRVAVGR